MYAFLSGAFTIDFEHHCSHQSDTPMFKVNFFSPFRTARLILFFFETFVVRLIQLCNLYQHQKFSEPGE
uniref:Uncharacterized protein n=1 Tax=Oryza brachyantha TaxID=4533 RepID=J3MCG1_ORYBR